MAKTRKRSRGGKGGRVKNRKQALAIGLSKARKKGKRSRRKNAEVPVFGSGLTRLALAGTRMRPSSSGVSS